MFCITLLIYVMPTIVYRLELNHDLPTPPPKSAVNIHIYMYTNVECKGYSLHNTDTFT